MALDKTKEKILVDLLKELEPGFLPYDVFVQVARLVPLSIIEFVPLRLTQGNVEVLLLERSKFDDIWPGEVHTPGTVVRTTDNESGQHQAFQRILVDELRTTHVSPPHFVGSILHKSKRGMEHAQIFWVEVLEEPKVGTFYPADQLPENIIDSQKSFIAQAVQNFKNNKT